jgi:asparagine synthase (glutamine-hydrolysing)
VKVAIGGDGGDELFGGYDRYYGNLYAGRYAAIPAALRRSLLQPLLALFPESGWYKSKGHQLRWLHQLSFLEGADRYAASLTYFYFNQDARRRLLTPEASRQLTSRPAEVAIAGPYRDAAGDPLDRMLHADSCVRLPDHPVMITDRMSMAHGLEARSPFMDHRLAEFAARLPNHLKVHGRALRVIQRRLARRYLPAEIIDRPKQGFSSALPYLLRAEYRTLYEAALSDSRLVQAGILQAGPIRELVSEQLAGRADHGNRLWLLVNAELWYRMMILGESSGSLAPSVTAAAI